MEISPNRKSGRSLAVKSTVPEVSFALSEPHRIEVDEFYNQIARTLTATFTGEAAAHGGVIDFTYAKRHIRLGVKKGDSLASVADRLERAILKAEGGSLTLSDWIKPGKAGPQRISFEVT